MTLMLFRFVSTELATDIVITVGDVKFYLHKVHRLNLLLAQSLTKLRFKPSVSNAISCNLLEKNIYK